MLAVSSMALTAYQTHAWAQAAETVTLSEIDVVATTPLGGSGIERAKVPYNTETLTSAEFQQTRQNEITEALSRRLPGISTNDVIGSPLVQELDYRGFVASPIPGTPEGLAVYQNGVRINEAWAIRLIGTPSPRSRSIARRWKAAIPSSASMRLAVPSFST